jgi:hypothetical protein
MATVTNILDSLENFYGSQFSEALSHSLSRVMAHSQEGSIGVVSASRKGNKREQNNAARRQLSQDVQDRGYGYTHVVGVGQEEEGPASERSLLVIGPKGSGKNITKSSTFKRHLMELGRKYGQMGILYKPHGSDSAKFIHTSEEHYGKEEDLGQWHPNDSAALFFTKLKGSNKQFSFGQKAESLKVVYLEPRGFFVRRDMFYS